MRYTDLKAGRMLRNSSMIDVDVYVLSTNPIGDGKIQCSVYYWNRAYKTFHSKADKVTFDIAKLDQWEVVNC